MTSPVESARPPSPTGTSPRRTRPASRCCSASRTRGSVGTASTPQDRQRAPPWQVSNASSKASSSRASSLLRSFATSGQRGRAKLAQPRAERRPANTGRRLPSPPALPGRSPRLRVPRELRPPQLDQRAIARRALRSADRAAHRRDGRPIMSARQICVGRTARHRFAAFSARTHSSTWLTVKA